MVDLRPTDRRSKTTIADGGVEPDEEETFATIEKWQRGRANAVDPEAFLRSEGVVKPIEDGQDIAMTDDFHALVTDHLEAMGEGRPGLKAIAALYGTEPAEIEAKDRSYPAFTVGRRVRKWPSDGALLLDVATHRALEAQSDRWEDIPPEQRVAILKSLRSFRELCPVCEGTVAFEDALVGSCCAEFEVLAYQCVVCGERLLELDPEPTADDLTGCTP